MYSKRLLKRWPGQKGKKGGPDFEEIIEITYWMEQVIYLILKLLLLNVIESVLFVHFLCYTKYGRLPKISYIKQLR